MKKTIMITDDDPGIQDIYKLILEKAGYATELVPDGERIMKNRFKCPVIFLLDKQLVGFDGLDLCRHLKSQESTRHIPVIMISATPGLSRAARQAGADAFMEKPFQRDELLAIVEKYAGAPV
ncbi:response regulator [Chitinophaga rupis]|nr:response regulator [Chitinophaga rupis]